MEDLPNVLVAIIVIGMMGSFFIGRFSGLKDGFKLGLRYFAADVHAALYTLPPEARDKAIKALETYSKRHS